MPKEFVEYLIVKDTKWPLEYVRNLSMRDYTIFAVLARVTQKIDVVKDEMKIMGAAKASF